MTRTQVKKSADSYLTVKTMDRIEKARDFFLQGYNCSQSVFCAFADKYGLDDNTSLKVSASFGGGIGRMRETCGAVCGAAMILGLEYGQTEPNDNESKQRNYQAVQELARRFKERNGSTICRELLSLRKSDKNSPVPSERTESYYKTRPCLRMVESAAAII